MNRRTLSLVGLGVTAGAELFAAVTRFEARKQLFAAAQRRATQLGRPLLVVGDPDAGLHTRITRAYPCGDVCVDLHGCPACPVQHVADLTKDRLPFDDDSAVVFVACVLEYVRDFEAALAELARVAGEPGNLFLVTVQPWTVTATLYPGATWHVHADGLTPTAERVTTAGKIVRAASLTALIAGALLPSR